MLPTQIVINDKTSVNLNSNNSLFKSNPRYALCKSICGQYFIQLIEKDNLLHLKLILKEYIFIFNPNPYKEYFEDSIILNTTLLATKKDLKFLKKNKRRAAKNYLLNRTNFICKIVGWYKIAKELKKLVNKREENLKGVNEQDLIIEALNKDIFKNP